MFSSSVDPTCFSPKLSNANKKLAISEAKAIKDKHEEELKIAKSESETKQKAAKAKLGKQVKDAKLKKQAEDKVKNKVASETAKVQQQSNKSSAMVETIEKKIKNEKAKNIKIPNDIEKFIRFAPTFNASNFF